MKRLTIADIAAQAGVSTGAVSYALNGKPGVSAATRERVLRIAAELGWRPSNAARALTRSRNGAIGLVVDRPADVLSADSFRMQLLTGIEAGLRHDPGTALMLEMTDDRHAEIETYRTWWAERRVDGVIVVDLREPDPRLAVLEEIGMPAVAVGSPSPGDRLPCVWSDDAAPMREVIGYLVALGHRRIAHVAGCADLLRTAQRDRAFREAAEEFGLERADTVHTDHSAEQGARATRRLLSTVDRPTAVIYDNDVMAVASLAAAQEMYVDVPGELSLIAWDDSQLCQLVRPGLTAVNRDVPEQGVRAVATLQALIRGEEVTDVRAPLPVLTPRGSTGRPPAH